MGILFEIKTAQVQSIKVLVETLHKLVTDTTFEVDETGVKNTDTNVSQTVLIHVKLDAGKFEHFVCKKPTVLGVNMTVLHRIMKTVHNSCTLCLFMEEEDPNHLGIRVDNVEKETTSAFRVNLLDLDNRMPPVNPIAFNSTIVIPSADFQKHIRDMAVVSDFVEIRSVGTELALMAKGDDYSMETTMRNIVTHDADDQSGRRDGACGEITQGEFHISYLVQFTHCTSISPMVEILMRNDYPILLQYSVASLGTIKLALMQTTKKS